MAKGKLVTQEELDYIMDNYQTIDTGEMSMKLGRSKGSIRAIYSKELREREEALYSDTDVL